jgi:hypothetical protein
MLITPEDYLKLFHRYYIIDCAVRSKDMLVFLAVRVYTNEEVAEEEENDWDPAYRDKHVVTYFRDDPPDEQWASTLYEGHGYMVVGAAEKPLNQCIAIDKSDDFLTAIGSGVIEDETITSNSPNKPLRGGIRKTKTLNGYAYVCAGNRSLAKRLGKEQWFSHNDSIPHVKGTMGDEGFEDFDGFSETDLYAAGGKGDVWHYNGESWRQIPFPTNSWVKSVCCGGDGQVYISCYEGLTFMGREDRWKKIHSGGIPMGWTDMVWYEDRVWCTNDNGLWTIHEGKVAYASDLPSEIRVCSGSLYVNDSVMLLAGLGGAAFRENGQWHSIFLTGRMEKTLRDKHKEENS